MSNESKLDQLLRQRAEIDELLRRHQTSFSVLFTDVVGSTEYFEKYGDIAGVAMLTRHEDVARKAIEERGGRVIKNIGDSVMAEFSDPVSAARAAVEIQRRLLRLNQTLSERERIQIRIGINHGIGFRHEGDVYGDVVNVAARITKRTGPAQILVSASVHEALASEADLRCNWLAKVPMKGKAEEGDVYEVVWTDTSTYADLRQHVTVALKRGDIMAPGLDPNELIQTAPPTPPPAPPEKRQDSFFATPPTASLESRYEMLGELGTGGMGIVYKARDRETGDLVALKVLRPEVASDEKGLQRFKNELRIARRITHKNVCRIHEFNRTGTTAYITMEFVEGESLRRVLNRFGSLGLKKGLDIARQICAGLHEAHAQGVVHRDLKPENVMLDAAGNAKVMDFGIAHAPIGAGLTQTHAVVGTPSYMSPEQAEGKPLDHRSDIYALGLILYEIFTGAPTFTAETPVAIAIKHIREAPVPPRSLDASIPEHINVAILRCLDKDPAKRFQSVDDLAAALSLRLTEEAAPVGAPAEAPAAEQTQMPSAAYYAPTPYGTPPAAAPPPATITFAPPSAPAAPAVQEVPVPVAAPRPAAGRKLGMLIGAVFVIVVLAVFVTFKVLRAPQPAIQPTQETAQQAAPSTVALPESKAPPTTEGTAQPPATSQPPLATTVTPAAPAAAPPGAAPKVPPTAATTPPISAGAPAPTSAPPPPAVLAPLSVSFSLARTLAGHTAVVSSVAFSPDGRWLATGSRDKTVRIWEAGTGQTIHTLKGHKDVVVSVAFNSDGRLVASGSQDRTATIWDASSGQALATLPRDPGYILCVAFSPDGRLLATSTSEGRIKLWDVSSGEGVQALDGHTGPVYAVAFSSDGRWLASAGRDQTVRLWNVASGQEARVLHGHSEAVNSVTFSPDGRWVASASDDKSAKLWDVATGRELRTFTGHAGGADGLAFSPDGRWLAAGSEDKTVKIWDTANGNELATLSGHIYAITDLAATRNGRWLASAAGDNTIRLWRRE